MLKIPTVFQRDFAGDPSRVTQEINPECQWVIDGEGTATRKYDGTCCAYGGGEWWKRREVKQGKPDPEGFKLLQEDPKTGKRVGWMPVTEEDKWHVEAIENGPSLVDGGTYELVGPKVQGNPEGYDKHVMIPHSMADECVCPRDWLGLSEWLCDWPYEGIVFHHPDGRMAKIKRRDFGYIK